jgi:hypothetical protein
MLVLTTSFLLPLSMVTIGLGIRIMHTQHSLIPAIAGQYINAFKFQPFPPQLNTLQSSHTSNSDHTVFSPCQQHIDAIPLGNEIKNSRYLATYRAENDHIIFFPLEIVYCGHFNFTDTS